MGLFDKFKKKPEDTQKHAPVDIPEELIVGGKKYERKYFFDDIELEAVTDYEFLENHDRIEFKEDGRTIHAFFDDAIDVGIVTNPLVVEKVNEYLASGEPYICSVRPRNMTLRAGFYVPKAERPQDENIQTVYGPPRG